MVEVGVAASLFANATASLFTNGVGGGSSITNGGGGGSSISGSGESNVLEPGRLRRIKRARTGAAQANQTC
jgi:hypothetical protein